jgi:hypothetical protein
MRCARCVILLIFCVVAISPAAAEQQSVAGITIDYTVPFERAKYGAEDAIQRRSATTWGVSASTFEAHQASIPPAKRLTGASGMLEVARAKFADAQQPDLDSVARRTIAAMLREPLKIVTQDISVDRLSGLDGRRVSFEAEAGSWTAFGQALLIHDPGRNDFWDIKIVLLRRFLATFFVASDRVYPKSILDTVRVVDHSSPTP